MSEFETRLVELEASVIAHRRLLAKLVDLLGPPERDVMLQWIDDRQILHDGQEDPGAIPSEAAVLPLSIAAEFQEIRALIKSR